MAGMTGPGLEETVEFCQAEMQWKVKDKNKQQQKKNDANNRNEKAHHV